MAGRSPNIQVSEVKYITAEAVRSGAAEIALKGKIRTILLPNRLCRKLQNYARQQKISSSEIFILKMPCSAGYSANELLPEKPGCRSRMLSLTELIITAEKCIIEKVKKGGTYDGHIDRAV